MPSDSPSNMTDRQRKWFASVIETMQAETGKSLEEWVAIARTCPETKPGARKAWFKSVHGVGTNRASIILGKAFPEATNWDRPDDLRGSLWSDAPSRAVLEAVEAAVKDFPGLVSAQRKNFTAFSKQVQFASIRPAKGGGGILGLALDPSADPRLEAPKRESWSERLKAVLPLATPADVDASVRALLKAAYDRS